MTPRIFLSYRHTDKDIAIKLRTMCVASGLRCWMDIFEINPSENWDEEIQRAISESKVLVILISDGTAASPKQQKRELMMADAYSLHVVPVYLVPPEKCKVFSFLLSTTNYINASKLAVLEELPKVVSSLQQLLSQLEMQEWERSPASASGPEGKVVTSSMDTATGAQDKKVSSASPSSSSLSNLPAGASPAGRGRPLQVSVLSKRGAAEDEQLRDVLRERLGARGHVVLSDHATENGDAWRRSIRENTEKADVVIPLISLFSVGSEMLEEELRHASLQKATDGSPARVLPVRVNYEGPLPPGLARLVQGLPSLQCRSAEDHDAVVNALLEVLEAPATGRTSTVSERREMPLGAVPLTSPFYVVRDGDHVFQAGVEHGDSILLVRGARQTGKTSLVARGLQKARERKHRVAISDFQTLSQDDFLSARSFYTALSTQLAEQLDLKESLLSQWDERQAPNANFKRFIREALLAADTPLLWALDEVDRLFAHKFGTDFFGLIRSWHNERALNPDAGWSKLTLVISYATEASLFIKDLDSSPFNVGTGVPLSDFGVEEVRELNMRYGHPLQGEAEIRSFMERMGGQPFLVRRGLYALSVEGISMEKLLAEAATERGVFSDHLRRYHTALRRDKELHDATREFILRGRELSAEEFNRLRLAGLVKGDTRLEAEIRCGIYRDYLRTNLS